MTPAVVQIHASWREALQDAFAADDFLSLQEHLAHQKAVGKVIYPHEHQIFEAFNLCPLQEVKVVILGQDPYHGLGQAHGLSFSVPTGVPFPPSLKNIFKALSHDLGIAPPQHGDLSRWARQGVLLLNSILTVNAGEAASHQKIGWERFTNQVIATVNDQAPHVVFLLWGNYAMRKASAIDPDKHLILTAPHPSPLAAHRGFINCKHFSQTNKWLQARGLEAIDW
jgi:uracil-DNA glycosylase